MSQSILEDFFFSVLILLMRCFILKLGISLKKRKKKKVFFSVNILKYIFAVCFVKSVVAVFFFVCYVYNHDKINGYNSNFFLFFKKFHSVSECCLERLSNSSTVTGGTNGRYVTEQKPELFF